MSSVACVQPYADGVLPNVTLPSPGLLDFAKRFQGGVSSEISKSYLLSASICKCFALRLSLFPIKCLVPITRCASFLPVFRPMVCRTSVARLTAGSAAGSAAERSPAPEGPKPAAPPRSRCVAAAVVVLVLFAHRFIPVFAALVLLWP